MNTKFNITEVFLAAGFFGCMALFTCAQHWEATERMASYDAWQMQSRLSLNADQATRLRAITLASYKTLSKAYQDAADNDSYYRRADAIIKERDQEILSLLTIQQRHAWEAQKAHCVSSAR